MNENYRLLRKKLSEHVLLVAVSKTKPAAMIREVYDAGHRDFGENYVQELVEKQPLLPADIRWHFIGHLQSNKVKYIAPFVYLIHGVDSLKLLREIDKQAAKNNRVIDVLLQMYIAEEETKFGLDDTELLELLHDPALTALTHICIRGLMGMASFTENMEQVRLEFSRLRKSFDSLQQVSLPNLRPEILSMGMSSDYAIAIEEGSTLVRIGSAIFGSR